MIPYIMMLALVISHTVAIHYLNKRRLALPLDTAEGQAKAKQMRLIILMLYIEIPLITAFIWFVVAPMMAPVSA